MENPADGKICRVIRTDVGRLTGAACAVIVLSNTSRQAMYR
ncbi:MAG: hypothetical protein K0S02_3389 [Achromobacter mucicolens]|jgi:hypothetical protein|nr:hypothetical protein [Achromobacter mucicolens]TQJ96428.1 hypothetical protein FBY20_3207 [Achromobacter sp. SLBN-14]CAB3831281.1 hypothetical protein LMG26686_00948 [Achromobacter mucicolens]